MNNLEFAIHKSAQDFGIPRLAKMMALGEQSLRNKLCPTNSVAKLSVVEFDAVLTITEDGFMSARECSVTTKEIREEIESLNVLLVSVERLQGKRV